MKPNSQIKKLNLETKSLMVQLGGNCFWFWNSFYSFLRSCKVPERLLLKYPKESFNKYDIMRNVLNDLDTSGQLEILQELISGFYQLKNPVDKDVKDPELAKRLLKEFKEHVGNDPIEEEIKKRETFQKQKIYVEAVESLKSKSSKLNAIKITFLKLLSDSNMTPQKKGFVLEDLFYSVLELEEFEYKKPFRNSTQQIDGLFKFKSFDYLSEIKLQGPTIKEKELAVFDNKIKGKAQSTRGFFLAPNGFDKGHIRSFQGNSPRLILMDGVDLMNILEERKTFYDIMSYKAEYLLKTGEILKNTI